MKKKYYMRIEMFAHKKSGGGHWEDDWLVDGESYKDCFNQALDFLKKKGWSLETKIVICKKNGSNFE